MSTPFDLALLERLLLLHSLLPAQTTERGMADVVRCGLQPLPGVVSVGVRIGAAVCGDQRGRTVFPLATEAQRYGKIKLSTTAAFEPYRILVASTAHFAALILENQQRHVANERLQAQLDERLNRQVEQQKDVAQANTPSQTQKMEVIGQLAGGIAHDFNNLLTVIQGNVELSRMALEQGDLAGVRELNEGIRDAGWRAADLTRQLLAFSYRRPAAPQPTDIASRLQGSRTLLRRLVHDNVRLEVAVEETTPWVLIDHSQFDRIVFNLVVNAQDAMPDGGRLVLSTLHQEALGPSAHRMGTPPAGPVVTLTVRDGGLGISTGHLDQIFKPFFTTKPLGRGTGLGLSTVFGAVTDAGGCVDVASEPGMGTVFHIHFPVLESAVLLAASVSVEEAIVGGSETLLLVEDDSFVCDIAERFLRSVGYRVLVAKDGEEGLHVGLAFEGPIHGLIADAIMPNMGGAELSEHLVLQRPQMRTLLVSGYCSELLRGRFDVGDVLPKPFSRRALLTRIRGLLDAGLIEDPLTTG